MSTMLNKNLSKDFPLHNNYVIHLYNSKTSGTRQFHEMHVHKNLKSLESMTKLDQGKEDNKGTGIHGEFFQTEECNLSISLALSLVLKPQFT